MRVILSLALVTILTGCQTTTHEDSNQSITKKLTSQLRSSAYYHAPMKMAKRVTNDFDIIHSLTVGDFQRYDTKTLEMLARTNIRLDAPGKNIIYQSTYLELDDILAILYNGLNTKPSTSTPHIAFLKKLKTRVLYITQEEKSQTAICLTDGTWIDFPSNQKEIFNKMVLGVNLSPEETLSLTYSPPNNTMKGKDPQPIKCLLGPIGLYSEFSTLYKLH